ncbi:outer membrane protein assembly factor BamB family protein [Microbulbifer celer]|uniref:PQQ-binding-like beta-propeller repeat protein n=1 Tax=Microbulbifer celer TaxID=435905 RepID=A0ABW3UC01_9GAMM|nr:PQQ-binding-like beta-propeller repeat protein [Microbulbifer celer]UFN58138.1 PQQ-binding-like beta-propeller repeat protein [Microbulbifer celer]
MMAHFRYGARLAAMVFAIAGCGPAANDSPAVVYRGNAERTGLFAGEGPAEKPQELWRFLTLGVLTETPVIAGDTLFVGTTDESVYALDLHTGKRRWRFKAFGNIRDSVAVDRDRVYVASEDNNFYTLDRATGEKLWSSRFDKTPQGAAAVRNGRVYFGGFDKKVRALDAATGTPVWEFAAKQSVGAGVTLVDDTVYVAAFDGRLYALHRETGKVLWQVPAGGGQWLTTAPAVHDGQVFVGGWGQKLSAIDTTSGEINWSFDAGMRVDHPPAVAHSQVYISGLGPLHVVDEKSGELRWTFGERIFRSVAATAERIYAACGKQICALQPDSGELLWRSETLSDTVTSITVYADRLYVGTIDGYIYALQ